MAGELFLDVCLKRSMVALLERVAESLEFVVRAAGEDSGDFVGVVDHARCGGAVDVLCFGLECGVVHRLRFVAACGA